MSIVSRVLCAILVCISFRSFGAEFLLAPDHFEIENVGSTPSITLSNDSSGTTVTMVFAPAYDVGQDAIGFARRADVRQAEIVRLSVAVDDVILNQLPIVGTRLLGVEKERMGTRVLVRARFGKDLASGQLRKLFAVTRAYGTVKGHIVCGPETPSSLCGHPVEAVALNPFHTEDGDVGKIARMKFAALTQYKTEVLLRPSASQNRLAWLDEQIRFELMESSAGDRFRCRSGISEYQDWICRIIVEQSKAGLMSEALFHLATYVYPPRFTGLDYRELVFDSEGHPVKGLSFGRPLDDEPVPTTEFERILGARANPSLSDGAYQDELREYLEDLFVDLSQGEMQAMLRNLVSIRSLSDDTPLNYALATLAVLSGERSLSDENRLNCLRLVLTNGRGYDTELESILKSGNESQQMEQQHRVRLDAYALKYFKNASAEQRALFARSFAPQRHLTENGTSTHEMVVLIFQRVEKDRLPLRDGDAGESTFEKLIRNRFKPGMTPELYEAAVREYVHDHFSYLDRDTQEGNRRDPAQV